MTNYKIIEESAATGKITVWKTSHERYLELAHNDSSGNYAYNRQTVGFAIEQFANDEIPETLLTLRDTLGIAAEIVYVNDSRGGKYYPASEAPDELEWADDVHGHDRRRFTREIIND